MQMYGAFSLLNDKMVEFSEWQEVNSPYTPEADGFLTVRFQLSSTLSGTGYVRDSIDGTVFSGPLVNGSVLMSAIPVIARRTYTLQSSQSSTDMSAKFIPLRTG